MPVIWDQFLLTGGSENNQFITGDVSSIHTVTQYLRF